MSKTTSGFTLVELLVAMTIISILAMLLLPVLSRVRAEAQKIACKSRIKQVGLALHMYSGDYEWFPHRSLSANNDEWAAAQGDNARSTTLTDFIYPNYVADLHVFYCPSFIWKQPGGSVVPPGFPWPWNWSGNFWIASIPKINYGYYTVYHNRSQHWKQSPNQSDKPPHAKTAARYSSAVIYYEMGEWGSGFTPIMVSHPYTGQSSQKNYNPSDGHQAQVLCYDSSAHVVRVPYGYAATAPQGYWLLKDAPK